jgi:predicted DNA binding protein
MGLWEVELRAAYDYPFIELSRLVPETPISMWCLWQKELLQVPTRDVESLKAVGRAIRQAGRVVEEWSDTQGARLFLLDCTCDRYEGSPWNLVEANRCWDLPPVVYRDGWVGLRVGSFEQRRPLDLFDALKRRGNAELLRKRELSLNVLPSTVWTGALFGDLTGRQGEALLAAHRQGYYASPRKVTTEAIAHRLGRGRTTYEEHLRKAENKVMASLIPYLELYLQSDRPTTQGTVPASAPTPKRSPGHRARAS